MSKKKETKKDNKKVTAKDQSKDKKTTSESSNNKFKKKFSIICSIILFLIAVCIALVLITRDTTKDSVRLETHSYEIYEWKYEIGDKKIVKFEEKKRSGDFEDKHGGAITETYIFKSLKPGKTTITFTFVNKNNKSYGEIKKYEVKVDKKNNLSITEVANN